MRTFDYQAGPNANTIHEWTIGSSQSLFEGVGVFNFTPFNSISLNETTPPTNENFVQMTGEVPGDATTTFEVTVGGSVSNTLEVAGDRDWFQVDLVAGQSYQFNLDGDNTNGTSLSDTYLRFYDTDGLTLIAENDDTNGLFSQLTVEATTTGTYYLSAAAFADFYTGDYTLSVEEGRTDAIADDVTTTTTLSFASPVTSTIDFAGDIDYMRLDVVEGQTYAVNMFSAPFGELPPMTNTWVEVYDYDADTDALTYLGAAYNFDGDTVGTFTATSTGELYAVARGINGETGAYFMRLDGATNNDTIAADVSTTATISLGETLNENLDVFGDTDWFKVTLEAGGEYVFNVSPEDVAYADEDIGAYGVPDEVLKAALQEGFEFPACACPGCMSQAIEAFGEDNGLVGLLAASDSDLRLRDANGNIVFNEDGTEVSGLQGILQFDAELSGDYYIEVFDSGTLTSGGYNLSFDIFIPPTPTEAIDWGTQLASNVVNVYFTNSGETADGGFTSDKSFTTEELAAFQAAFDMFEGFTDLEFNIVSDQASAEFVFVLDSTIGGLGRMGPPGFDSGEGVGVFQWQTSSWSTAGLTPGGDGFNTIVHEIGHGLGLAHPHDDGGTSAVLAGVTSAFNSYGDFALNQSIWTMMSYNRGFPTGQGSGNDFFGVNATPMAVDIAVLQSKYGADMTANTGDDTYNLPDQSGVGIGWEAIWDAGGNDRIRYDGADNTLIDLREATLQAEAGGGGFASFAGSVLGGFTIANGVVIERALSDAGNDILVGNAADNELSARAGDDIVIATGGSDTINGGANFDMVSYVFSDKRVVVNLDGVTREGVAAGTALETADGSVDTLTAIEFAMGGSAGDSLYGSNRRNTLIGNEGDDVLNGRGGQDTLLGGAGDDVLNGSGGIDTADYSEDTSGVTVDLDLGSVDDGFGTQDTLISIENIIGSDFDDVMTGNSINNRFFLGAGDDSGIGGGGNDTMFGGAGVDTLEGGIGSDRLYGEDGDDIINGQDGIDILDGGAGNDQITGEAGNDKMYGRLGNDVLNGGNGLDFMFGQEGNDELFGGDARDYMYGGTGDDRIQGDAGDDLIYGNDGSDTAVFSGNFADYAITVRANGTATVEDLVGNEGFDRLYRVEFLEFADGVYDITAI